MFLCQVVSTVVAGTVQLGVQAWVFSNAEDIYSPDQKDSFICPDTTVSGTTSITVSLSCGPHLVCIAQGLLLCCSGATACLFSYGQLYFPLFFPTGARAPLSQWFLHKKFKIGFLRYLNFPLVFTGALDLPPATGRNYVPRDPRLFYI